MDPILVFVQKLPEGGYTARVVTREDINTLEEFLESPATITSCHGAGIAEPVYGDRIVGFCNRVAQRLRTVMESQEAEPQFTAEGAEHGITGPPSKE